MTTQTRPGSAATMVRSALPSLAAALIAVSVSGFFPLLGPLLIALIIGAAVANTRLSQSRALADHTKVTTLLLRLGVVLVGLRLPLSDIASIGARGLLVIGATVAVTFVLTRVIGNRMTLDEGYVVLLSAGFAICGAAAIAAVSDAVRARQKDIALAVAMVTLFGSAMIVVLPWLSTVCGLSDQQAAIWAGASIHEVAQVVAAASLVGGGTAAVAIATTVKLGRVALLAPTYIAVARGSRTADRRDIPLVPWFLIGFALMVALRSVGVLNAATLSVTDYVTTLLLAAAMFGLGLGFRLRDLWPVPPQALVLAAVSTLIAGATSLGLIVALY